VVFYFDIEVDFELINILKYLRREDPKNFAVTRA